MTDHDIEAEATVVDWEWRDSDSGYVQVAGLDADGEVVVKRHFTLVSTTIRTPDGEWVEVDDDGGWTKDPTFLKHEGVSVMDGP